MKKLILVLFLCLSCFSFGEWSIQGYEDEFGDLTGEQYVFSMEKENMGGCRISKTDGKYLMAFASLDYIGGKGEYNTSRVRFKIDNLEPITFYGVVVSNGRLVGFNIDTKTIVLLKKGSELKVSIQKYDDTTILQKYSLSGFTKAFNDFNNSY